MLAMRVCDARREQELPKKLGAVAAILALVDTVSMQDEKIKIDLAQQLNRTLENSSNEGLLREVHTIVYVV